MKKVLFVCLGNICRSPAAEAIFLSIVAAKNDQSVLIDSAGTSGFHSGQLADSRMRKFLELKGYQATSRSRQISLHDFDEFDYILVADESNKKNVLSLGNAKKEKVFKMLDFSIDHKGEDVPDPYYGGDQGFSLVINLLEESLNNFYQFIKT